MPSTVPAIDDIQGNSGAILACIVGLACSIASLGITYSIGVFVAPLHSEFGWSREQILTAQSIVTLVVVFASPLVGWICDRHGVRGLLIASQTGFALGFFALGALVHSLAAFYVLYALMALLASGTVGVPFVKLLTARFDRRRGLALGIAMTGTGLCGMVVPPYASAVLTHYGWRMAFVSLGLLPLLLALPLTLLWVRDIVPGRSGPTHEAASRAGAAADVAGRSVAEALRDYRFWIMCVAFFVCSGAITAFLTNLVPLLGERGVPAGRAAALASAFGLAVIFGRVAVGALIDRLWAPLVGFALFSPAALAIAALSTGGLSAGATILAIAFGGLAAGAEVDLIGYLASRYFGLRHFARIYALIYVAFALGPGVIVPLIGRMRDHSGSYSSALLAISAGVLTCGVMLLALGRYPAPRPGVLRARTT
jgi:MFS family permease